MKYFSQKTKYIRGFTLLETLVAISVFTTSSLALFSVLGQGVASTNLAQRKIVATYLAEEGVERVRNIRDNQTLFNAGGAQAGWEEFSSLVSPTCDTACYLNDSTVLSTCGESCPEMLYDAENGKYNYSSGNGSGYTRRIRAELLGEDEIKIYSYVSWSQGSGVHEVVFSESLFNWIE